jgi:hypothetical protein
MLIAVVALFIGLILEITGFVSIYNPLKVSLK